MNVFRNYFWHLFAGVSLALFGALIWSGSGMFSNNEILAVANELLHPKGLDAISANTLQSLWAGYGHICDIEAVPLKKRPDGKPEKEQSLILKYVTPPSHPSKAQDEGHLRKVISYQVEQFFYSKLAPSMPSDVAVAECLGSMNEHNRNKITIAMVLTDLRKSFPVAGEKRGELNEAQVYAAIDWLAKFHGFWWQRRDALRQQTLRRPPLEEAADMKSKAGVTQGVWLNGGYTYLATRRMEYDNLKRDTESEWSDALCNPFREGGKSIAELVASVLAPSSSADYNLSKYETLIHGDVKSENLFSTSSGTSVAFYDFQYVGLGFGVSDLAKLFTVSVPLELLTSEGLGVKQDEAVSMSTGEETLLR